MNVSKSGNYTKKDYLFLKKAYTYVNYVIITINRY